MKKTQEIRIDTQRNRKKEERKRETKKDKETVRRKERKSTPSCTPCYSRHIGLWTALLV